MKNTEEKWNNSHLKIPKDKSVSNYAIDKEKLFPKNAIVLDLGGGTGVDAVYFAKQGHTVTLADISTIALDLAVKKASVEQVSVETVLVDLAKGKIPFKVNTFDIVYSRLALHYFDIQNTTKIFEEINRILKPSGLCFLTVKSPKDKDEMLFLKQNAKEIEKGLFLENGYLKSRYSSNQLKDILNTVGIKNYTVKTINEDLWGRVDKIKSGNKVLILNEIIWKK